MVEVLSLYCNCEKTPAAERIAGLEGEIETATRCASELQSDALHYSKLCDELEGEVERLKVIVGDALKPCDDCVKAELDVMEDYEKRCSGEPMRVSQETVPCAWGSTTVFVYRCPDCGREASAQMPEHALKELREHCKGGE